MFAFVLLAVLILTPRKSSQVAEDALKCGNPKEAFSLSRITSLDTEYGCPAYSQDEINNVNKYSSVLAEWQNCLIEKSFPEDDGANKLCKVEVKPILFLAQNRDKNPITCGDKKNRYVYNFGYVYCRRIDDQQTQEQEQDKDETKPSDADQERNLLNYVQHFPIYAFCSDIVENRTIWTRHQIRTPSLFHSTEFQEENYCNTEISTEGYFFGSEHFLEMQKKYNLEKKKNPSIKIQMLPQPMVPANHFFKRAWKKATNHFINIAPLWSNLTPLMTTIDNAIKKIAINIKVGRIASGDDLLIYTRTKPYFSVIHKLKNIFTTESFKPNIWYKFVYNAATKSGVLIHIYNTPGNAVKVKRTKILCNFQEWAKRLNIQKEGDSDARDVTLPGLNYAYCTKPTIKDLKRIFHIDVPVQGFLDIDMEMMVAGS